MNIAMFTNTCLPHVGGVARSVEAFAGEFRRMGHKCLVIAPRFPGAEASKGHTIRVPAIQNFNGSDFSVHLALPPEIDERIEKFRPAIIHSHHPFLLGDSALRIARQLDLPLVFTHHTLYEQYTHYVPLDAKQLKNLVIHLSTEYANLCAQVVAPSESVARLIRERGVTKPVEVIPTGIDIEFFSSGDRETFREKTGLKRENVVIGHLGRLAPEKNLAYLADAAALTVKKDSRSRFLVAGKGPSEKDIRSAFIKHGIEDRLITAGVQTGQDLAGAYAAMDVFVFSSQSETQGMVLTEAMAAGLPVVALDGPGVREVVRDGANGALLPGDAGPEEFSARLDDLLADASALKRMAAAARQTSRNFSQSACAEKLFAIYQRLAENGEPKAHNKDPFNRLLKRLETEWDLLAEKTSAAAAAFKDMPAEKKKLD